MNVCLMAVCVIVSFLSVCLHLSLSFFQFLSFYFQGHFVKLFVSFLLVNLQ